VRRLVGPLAAVALAAAPSGATAAEGGRLLIGSCVDPPFKEAHGELFTVLPRGREPSRIRKLPPFGTFGCTDTNPMWSPDGRRIVYNLADDVAVGPAAPRRRYRLDRIVARDGFWPAWSPESRRLAFLRRGEDGQFRVAVVGVGGGRVHDLVGPGPFEWISWTRSGRHVLYSTNVPGGPNTPEMWRIAASGGRAHSLGRGRFARMSPDGRRIAFALGEDVWTMNPDGSGRRRIVDHPQGTMSWQLAWSPNGRRIAYVFYPEVEQPFTELHLVGRNGRGRRTVNLPRRLRASRWVDWGGG
jgi:dipeptidyl aminopeptidase/acylaminoacyl peptidase